MLLIHGSHGIINIPYDHVKHYIRVHYKTYNNSKVIL